jgi:iron(III) transport system substrate-binding protein
MSRVPFAAAVLAVAGATPLLLPSSCAPERREVVVYCALDQEFAATIFEEFEKQSGIHVTPQFDDEVTKTVGLTNRIKLEKERPRADVFWNNEVVQTVRLKNAGCLEPYRSASAADVPAEWKDPEGFWTGFAARARILAINTKRCAPGHEPNSYLDLADPARKGEAAIAKPVAGTTATHLCVLYEVLGAEKAKAWFDSVRNNDCGILAGNGPVMREVREGRYAFGFTDTDDFNVALLEECPVKAIYPDQGEGGLGCLVIPNSIALVKGAPHADDARRFIDFALSTDVEKRLAFGRSAQIPVRAAVATPPGMKRLADLRLMKVDFAKAALQFEKLPQ